MELRTDAVKKLNGRVVLCVAFRGQVLGLHRDAMFCVGR